LQDANRLQVDSEFSSTPPENVDSPTMILKQIGEYTAAPMVWCHWRMIIKPKVTREGTKRFEIARFLALWHLFDDAAENATPHAAIELICRFALKPTFA